MNVNISFVRYNTYTGAEGWPGHGRQVNHAYVGTRDDERKPDGGRERESACGDHGGNASSAAGGNDGEDDRNADNGAGRGNGNASGGDRGDEPDDEPPIELDDDSDFGGADDDEEDDESDDDSDEDSIVPEILCCCPNLEHAEHVSVQSRLSNLHTGYFRRFRKMTRILQSTMFAPVSVAEDDDIGLRVSVTVKYTPDMWNQQIGLVREIEKMAYSICRAVNDAFNERRSQVSTVDFVEWLSAMVAHGQRVVHLIGQSETVTFTTTAMTARTLTETHQIQMQRIKIIRHETKRVMLTVKHEMMWMVETNAWVAEVTKLLQMMYGNIRDMNMSLSKILNDGRLLRDQFHQQQAGDRRVQPMMAIARSAHHRQQFETVERSQLERNRIGLLAAEGHGSERTANRLPKRQPGITLATFPAPASSFGSSAAINKAAHSAYIPQALTVGPAKQQQQQLAAAGGVNKTSTSKRSCPQKNNLPSPKRCANRARNQ